MRCEVAATHTEVLQVDSLDPNAAAIAKAVEVLRSGRLVAFPTETVYGLGANAFDAEAVGGIFSAKGRPPSNPVIVHIARLEQLREVVADWPDDAQRLSDRFWPGPLSLVLAKHSRIPTIVTAGGPTVAVRMPAHPIAEQLILAADLPVAAPSANRSTRISPTSAAHVLRMLDGRIDLVLDAGTTPNGLESTVLDLTVDPPLVLRPGLIGRDEIAQTLDRPVALSAAIEDLRAAQGGQSTAEGVRSLVAKSPGQSARHYAPQVPVECHESAGRTRVRELVSTGLRVGWLHWEDEPLAGPGAVEFIPMPRNVSAYATRLYAALHRLEELGVERIIVDLPSDEEKWLAVRDRLTRASR